MTLSLLLLLPSFGVVRDPSSTEPIRFQNPSVTVVVDATGLDGLAGEVEVEAARAALETWQAACSPFRFVFGGAEANGSRANDDDVNRIVFVESGWPAAANGATATTLRRRNTSASPDVWVEADILVNGEAFSWSVDGNVQARDLQSILAHELGHVLGLQHASRPESTMYFGSVNGVPNNRTLEPDDLAGLCYLYPSGAFRCSTDFDCPVMDATYGGDRVKTHCVLGACAAGVGADGSDCFTNADCASGHCSFDPLNTSGADPGMCSPDCARVSCPFGDYCQDGSCIAGRDDCSSHDDCNATDRNRVCARDLDGRFRCTNLCRDNGWCETGQVCHGGQGQDPPGFCRAPGGLPAGSPCRHGLECATLSCTSGGAQPTCSDVWPGYPPVDPSPFVVDAGQPDAGNAKDGDLLDAGEVRADAQELDAGETDQAKMLSGGCGCRETGRSGLSGLVGIVLVLSLGRRPKKPLCTRSSLP